VILDVLIEYTGERCRKSGDVSSALARADVIDVRMDVFDVGVVPLKSELNIDRAIGEISNAMNVDRFGEEGDFILVEILDKRNNSAFVVEANFGMLGVPFITVSDFDPLIKES